MGAHQNVNVCGLEGNYFELMSYCTHHSHMDVHHYVKICVL